MSVRRQSVEVARLEVSTKACNTIRRIAAADALALLQQPALTVAPGTTTAAKAHIATAAERARLVNRQLKEVIRRLDALVDQLAGPDVLARIMRRGWRV